MSDDGAYAFVVIAMVGNPFSPFYARARERGDATALDFTAMNVCIYGPGVRRWALTERAIVRAARERDAVQIGESRMAWDGGSLVVDLEERTSPMKAPIRGRIRFHPISRVDEAVALDAEQRHTWWPIAPRGRVEVELAEPRVRFSGTGYHDANAGKVPLEVSFARWNWSRGAMRGERTLLTYDVVEREGARVARAWVATGGALEAIDAPVAPLPATRWFRVPRETRSEARASVVRELEDTPFYARALVRSRVLGEDVTAMHEAVSLDRFRTRWVRAMLGYRMARA